MTCCIMYITLKSAFLNENRQFSIVQINQTIAIVAFSSEFVLSMTVILYFPVNSSTWIKVFTRFAKKRFFPLIKTHTKTRLHSMLWYVCLSSITLTCSAALREWDTLQMPLFVILLQSIPLYTNIIPDVLLCLLNGRSKIIFSLSDDEFHHFVYSLCFFFLFFFNVFVCSSFRLNILSLQWQLKERILIPFGQTNEKHFHPDTTNNNNTLRGISMEWVEIFFFIGG